jgi:hypothetical protein
MTRVKSEVINVKVVLRVYTRYVLLGHNRNRFMVERPFYWCTKPTPTKLFIPLNYIEWSV